MNDLKATTYPNEEKSYTYDLFNNNPYVEFHENGNKRIEINFNGGLLHGSRDCWYESGQIEEKANYKDGKLDGLYTSWYESGTKESESYFINGKKDGVYLGWHESGQLKHKAYYKDDLFEKMYEWDEYGISVVEIF